MNHNQCTMPAHLLANHPIAREMAAYDRLHPVARRAFREAPFDWSVVDFAAGGAALGPKDVRRTLAIQNAFMRAELAAAEAEARHV